MAVGLPGCSMVGLHRQCRSHQGTRMMIKNPNESDQMADIVTARLIQRAQSDPAFLARLEKDPEGTVQGELTPDELPMKSSMIAAIRKWLMGGKRKWEGDFPPTGAPRG